MSVVTELTPPAAPSVKRTSTGLGRFRSRLSAALRALAAGMRASKDYRLLNGMSAGQLRMLGLTHADIPRELHRRHFAGEMCDRELKMRGISRTDVPAALQQKHFATLAGWLDNID